MWNTVHVSRREHVGISQGNEAGARRALAGKKSWPAVGLVNWLLLQVLLNVHSTLVLLPRPTAAISCTGSGRTTCVCVTLLTEFSDVKKAGLSFRVWYNFVLSHAAHGELQGNWPKVRHWCPLALKLNWSEKSSCHCALQEKRKMGVCHCLPCQIAIIQLLCGRCSSRLVWCVCLVISDSHLKLSMSCGFFINSNSPSMGRVSHWCYIHRIYLSCVAWLQKPPLWHCWCTAIWRSHLWTWWLSGSWRCKQTLCCSTPIWFVHCVAFLPSVVWDPNTITLCLALSCSRKPVDCNALLLQCCLIVWLVCWFCFCEASSASFNADCVGLLHGSYVGDFCRTLMVLDAVS